MSNSAQSKSDSPPATGNETQNVSSHGAQLSVEQPDNNCWQTVHFPGTLAADQIPGSTPYLQTNAMDSSSTHPSISPSFDQISSPEPSSQRETELLDLVRDLNECNDVLLAKVSQLEESLERSQAALQAEIDHSGNLPQGDREIVQLVTELEQSNQALQHHQRLNKTLQTELATSRERALRLETEHTALLQQSTAHSQELLQANTNCRDLRARLQRQQRYTLQFKAALEKCLSMSAGTPNSGVANLDTSGIAAAAMPKTEEIRPWASTQGVDRLDPQLESMIRGIQAGSQPASFTATETEVSEIAAEDQLWHDLARVMEPKETSADFELHEPATTTADEAPQFTEPSPWGENLSEPAPDDSTALSPQVNEILARVQSAQVMTAADTYLPAISSTQSSPSPVVNPLKPQKRIGSLAAIDLPNFPRLEKQPPIAKT
ncbi:MAG: hypothetical protein AAF572_08315 [Cyanobacteria bacterium P01_B01_bin.77]